MSLQVNLTEGEKARVFARSTNNLPAYLKLLKGRSHWLRINTDDNAVARQFFEEAIVLDPEYAAAYVDLAWTHLMDIHFGVSKSPKESVKRAAQLAQKAISLDETSPFAHGLLGSIFTIRRQFEKAIAQGEKAVALSPSDSLVKAQLGRNLAYMGRYEEALSWLDKAIRLDPIPQDWYFNMVGHCYLYMGQLEKALEELKKNRNKKDITNHIRLAAVYSLLGREEDANAEADEILRLNQKFSTKSIKRWPYKNKADADFLIAALHKAGLPEHPPLPLPDKPSIAVLAFDNLSGDPEQEYFSDGIAENIITALSKVGELFVIARNSSFTYKDKPVKVQQVGRELGVRYVLEGSVQKSGDRVRITAQLIDAKNGQHLWAENYDRILSDIFEIQDEITMKVVTALRVELTEGEQARMFERHSKNLAVYLKQTQGLFLWRKGTMESLTRFGQLGQEIAEIEPESTTGYNMLGWYHWDLAMRGISPRESIGKSFKFAQKALSLGEFNAGSCALLGNIYLLMRKHDQAIESGRRAVELAPNAAFVHGTLGFVLSYTEHLDEAVAHYKQAIRLNPFPPSWIYFNLGRCYREKGQYEDALTELKKALQRSPNSYHCHVGLASVYALLDRQEEAEAAAKKVMEMNPKFSVARASKVWPYKNPADRKILADALRKAGLPD